MAKGEAGRDGRSQKVATDSDNSLLRQLFRDFLTLMVMITTGRDENYNVGVFVNTYG